MKKMMWGLVILCLSAQIPAQNNRRGNSDEQKYDPNNQWNNNGIYNNSHGSNGNRNRLKRQSLTNDPHSNINSVNNNNQLIKRNAPVSDTVNNKITPTTHY